MRRLGARTAVLAALLAFGVAIVAESQAIATVALGATFVLLPAAVFIELVRRDSSRGTRARIAQVVCLFACGALVFADEQTLAVAAFAATVLLLALIGFVEGQLRAVWWAAVLLGSALIADALWQLGWDPFDRSNQYEAIPASPFVLIGLPLPMAVVAAGVAARRLWHRGAAGVSR